MTVVFRVPIHGSLLLLLGLSIVYLFALLALGLLVSSRAKTQMEAIQLAQMFLLPSIMLSGYIFPIASLPGPLHVFSQVLPATHFIAISRGIIIRGAVFADLWRSVVALLVIATRARRRFDASLPQDDFVKCVMRHASRESARRAGARRTTHDARPF